MADLSQDNTIAKVAVPQKEAEVQQTPRSNAPPEIVAEKENLPPSVYAEIKHRPLMVDLLGYREQLNHFEVKAQSEEIDNFLREEITRLALEDTQKAYNDLLKEYLKKAQINKNMDIYTKIERLLDFVRIQRKLIEAVKEKEDLLKADIKDLNSAQLKRLIEYDKNN